MAEQLLEDFLLDLKAKRFKLNPLAFLDCKYDELLDEKATLKLCTGGWAIWKTWQRFPREIRPTFFVPDDRGNARFNMVALKSFAESRSWYLGHIAPLYELSANLYGVDHQFTGALLFNNTLPKSFIHMYATFLVTHPNYLRLFGTCGSWRVKPLLLEHTPLDNVYTFEVVPVSSYCEIGEDQIELLQQWMAELSAFISASPCSVPGPPLSVTNRPNDGVVYRITAEIPKNYIITYA